jgi:four helix bundle protein
VSLGNGELDEGLDVDDPKSIEPQGKIFDIRERTFQFAVRIVKLCQYLEKNSRISRRLLDQLLDAGTSVGANLEEARPGQSSKDFVHKNSISLKEIRETSYWLRLLLATYDLEKGVKNGIEELMGEASEITKIIAKIIVNTKS